MRIQNLLINIIFFLFSNNAFTQLKIVVTAHPKFLGEDKKLFMASNLNNWSPSDPNYLLTKDFDGSYSITLPDTISYFEYKFTQGSWLLVEGNAEGKNKTNRVFINQKKGSPQIIKTKIDTWELKSSYVIIVNKIPENTPKDASLYIAGNFNNWKPGDENSKLQLQEDNTYRIIVYSDLPKLIYKFTRGTWEAVEGRKMGKARPNRIFSRAVISSAKSIEVEIESWEDLSGTFAFFSIFDLLLLFAAFQGLLLIIAIPSIQDYNRVANTLLVILIAVASVMVLLHELSNHREFAQAYPKLLLLPNFIVFLYAPLFYFYLNKLLFQTKNLPDRWQLHFIPVLLQLLVFLPYLFIDGELLKLKMVNDDFDLKIVLSIIGFLGLIYNFFYWNVCRKMIKTYRKGYSLNFSYEQNLQYFNAVLFIQAFCLMLWLFLCIWWCAIFLGLVDDNFITEQGKDVVWLVFSTIVYFLGYYAIHQPEIFKIAQQNNAFFEPEIKSEKILKNAISTEKIPLIDDQISQIKLQLEQFMEINKPFENPKLTLNELANKLKIQPHILSKVINEGFNLNFFDFVNSYRVEEFIKRIKDQKYKNYTLLSIAFDVGFNSKTAFNRSFKKLKNRAPSDFIV